MRVLTAVLVILLCSCTDPEQGVAEDDRAVEQSACGEEPCTPNHRPSQRPAPYPGPPSPPRALSEFVAAMPAGSWGQFGQPWSVIDPGRNANCGRVFSKVLGAWNGVLWDGRYIWQWAGGGHGDGCNNGLMRYDLEIGAPEWIVPHKPLNVPYCRTFIHSVTGELDCYNEPYVSETPWPAGMNLTKAERLADGPTTEDVFAVEDKFGAFVRPRSSHMYNNMVRIGDWVYLVVGNIWGSGKGDYQVWRFNSTVPDIESTIERVADNYDPKASGGRGGLIVGGKGNVNWVSVPRRMPFALTGSGRCTPVDLEAGVWDCEVYRRFRANGTHVARWDAGRWGLWSWRPKLNNLAFSAENAAGELSVDRELSVTDPTLAYAQGLCLVPTAAGINPVLVKQNGDLIRWDGSSISTVKAPGAPTRVPWRVYNKWIWDDSVGACLGTFTTDEAIWVYKPDFSN